MFLLGQNSQVSFFNGTESVYFHLDDYECWVQYRWQYPEIGDASDLLGVNMRGLFGALLHESHEGRLPQLLVGRLSTSPGNSSSWTCAILPWISTDV